MSRRDIARIAQRFSVGERFRYCTSPEGTAGWTHVLRDGAFGVSVSLLDKTIEYIKNQKEHHRKMTFQEEFLALLKWHRIAYDPRYLWE